MSSTTGNWLRLEDLATASIFLCLSFWVAIAPGFFSPITWGLDDAAMYLRYLHNLRHGFGLVWNQGEAPIYGLTSLLYLAWLGIAQAITNLQGGQLLVTSSWFFGLASLLLLLFLTKELTRGSHLVNRNWPVALVVSWVGFHPYFRQIAMNGMESTLSLGANTVLVLMSFRLARQPSVVRAISTGIAGYLAFCTRPENFTYALSLPLLCILISGTLSRSAGRILVTYYATLVALLLCDSAVKLWYFGDVFPLSFYVKRSELSAGLGNGSPWSSERFLFQFLSLSAPFLAIPILCATLRRDARILLLLIPVLVHFTYLASAVQIMGFFGRLYLSALPVFVAIAVLCLCSPRSFAFSKSQRALRVVLALGLTAWLLMKGIEQPKPEIKASEVGNSLASSESAADLRLGWHHYINAWYHILKALPEGVAFATSEHGFLGANFTNIRIVDLSGLHNSLLAKSKFSALAITEQNPDILWLPPFEYTSIRSSLTKELGRTGQYCMLPGLMRYGVAVRLASPHYAQILSGLSRESSRLYGRDLTEEAFDCRGKKSTLSHTALEHS